MIFWCVLSFIIGVFIGVVIMCIMNASSRDKHIDYHYFDDCDYRE